MAGHEKRIAALLARFAIVLTAMLSLAWPALASEQTLTLARDGATLSATLLMPEGGGKVPAVLIVAGSGPTDRDGNVRLPGGNMLRNDSLKQLADALAARGVASLRFDKRGVGGSAAPTADESALRFGTFVGDAAAWADQLAAEPRVGQVFLLGHSEGALIATLAARDRSPAGLILIAGAGEPAGRLIRRQLDQSPLPAELRADAERVLRELEAGRTVSDPPPMLAALFRQSVQPYLISWLPIDPAAELRNVRAPVLIVQGLADLQIGEAEARRLAAARPDARLSLIEGMNHVLKPVSADRAANMASYGDPALAISPAVVEAVGAFVLAPPKPGP